MLTTVIAEHACRKYSGRVGRSAPAKTLDEQAVRFAVTAHVRHTETNYDELLSSMFKRSQARTMVRDAVAEAMELWKGLGTHKQRAVEGKSGEDCCAG